MTGTPRGLDCPSGQVAAATWPLAHRPGRIAAVTASLPHCLIASALDPFRRLRHNASSKPRRRHGGSSRQTGLRAARPRPRRRAGGARADLGHGDALHRLFAAGRRRPQRLSARERRRRRARSAIFLCRRRPLPGGRGPRRDRLCRRRPARGDAVERTAVGDRSRQGGAGRRAAAVRRRCHGLRGLRRGPSGRTGPGQRSRRGRPAGGVVRPLRRRGGARPRASETVAGGCGSDRRRRRRQPGVRPGSGWRSSTAPCSRGIRARGRTSFRRRRTGGTAGGRRPSDEDFMAGVSRAREHILAGDIFQVVLSRRWRRCPAAPRPKSTGCCV